MNFFSTIIAASISLLIIGCGFYTLGLNDGGLKCFVYDKTIMVKTLADCKNICRAIGEPTPTNDAVLQEKDLKSFSKKCGWIEELMNKKGVFDYE